MQSRYNIFIEKFLVIAVVCLFSACGLRGQTSFETSEERRPTNTGRKFLFYSSAVAGSASSYYLLSKAWFGNYDKAPLHTFNDWPEWMQMDKVGHFLTCYHLGMAGHRSMLWTGAKKKTALWAGGSLGFLFMGGVELLDGFNRDWGFSFSDLGANAAGSMLYISQQLIFERQIITPKFSYRQSPYAQLRPEILGKSATERWLKDYNGQVYWLGINLHECQLNQRASWLNIAVGYGADRMISGRPDNLWQTTYPWLAPPQREWYLSLDADLYRIKSRKAWVKTMLHALSFIKIPAPALGFRRNGGLRFYPLFTG
jgi:hypothetical protein